MKRKFVAVTIILLASIISFSLIKNVLFVVQSGGRLKKESENVAHLKQENTALKEKIAQAQKPGYVEMVARDQLNMAYPKETVLVIPRKQASEAAQTAAVVQGSNWVRWYKLFFQ